MYYTPTGYYDKTCKHFTVLLNVKSVGVMGDNRTYDNTVCVRIVEATDGYDSNICSYSTRYFRDY